MAYTLGVDLGTTYTAAAIADARGGRMIDLAHDRVAIRSLVAPPVDGQRAVVGEEALSIAATNPERVAREFKRRFGDPTPMIVNGEAWEPERLSALLLDEVVRRAVAMEGEQPDEIVITHPATWREHRLELLDEMASSLGFETVSFLPEPVAAAIHYHERSRVPDAARIAVYDLGGGTFDSAVLERGGESYRILGEPQGLDWVGGLDLDEAVFALVVEAVGEAITGLDPSDSGTARAIARLKEECTQAKVGLSFESSVLVPVVLPGEADQVVVHRADFEGRVEHLVEQTVDALERALDSAGLAADDLHAVLLVGGSSRVPMVAEHLMARLGVEVVVDTHPKHAVAMGAALSTRSLPDELAEVAEVLETVERQVIPEMTIDVSQLRQEVVARYLLPLTGPLAGLPLEIPEKPLTIGRIDDGEVVGLPDPLVSRRHLEVARVGPNVTVRDIGSTNGTYLDGVPIKEAAGLQPGAIVEVGTTLLLIDGPLATTPAPAAVAETWRMPSLRSESGVRGLLGGKRASQEWASALLDKLDELTMVSDSVRRARRLSRSSGPRAAAWTELAPSRVHERPSESDTYGAVTIGYGPLPSPMNLEIPDGLRSAESAEVDVFLGPLRVDPWSPIVVSLLHNITSIDASAPKAVDLLRAMLFEFVSYHPDEPVLVYGLDPLVTGWEFLQAGSVSIAEDETADPGDALVVSFGPGRVASAHVSGRGFEVGERGSVRVLLDPADDTESDSFIGPSGDEGVCRLSSEGTDLVFIPATLPADRAAGLHPNPLVGPPTE